MNGSLTVVIADSFENNEELSDVLMGRVVQTGTPMVDLSKIMINSVKDSADYVGAWEQFLPNVMALIYVTRMRLFIISLDTLSKRWRNVTKFLSHGLVGMFNSVGIQVLALRPMEYVNAIISVNDIRDIQTGTYALCPFGGLETIGVNNIKDHLKTEVQSRRSSGLAIRAALMSLGDTHCLGATLADINTAYHSEHNHTFSGLGLDDPYYDVSRWDGSKADSQPFTEWYDVLLKAKGRYNLITKSSFRLCETDIASVTNGKFFFIIIGSDSGTLTLPFGSVVCPLPYVRGWCIIGMASNVVTPIEVKSVPLKAWMAKPVELHHAQARLLVESCIERRETFSHVVSIRPGPLEISHVLMDDDDDWEGAARYYPAYARRELMNRVGNSTSTAPKNDSVVLKPIVSTATRGSIEWFSNSWDRDWDSVGDVSVFWTKNIDDKEDPYTIQFDNLDVSEQSKHRRVAYDAVTSIDEILGEFRGFLAQPGDKHVWIQGTYGGKGPDSIIDLLRMEVPNSYISTEADMNVDGLVLSLSMLSKIESVDAEFGDLTHLSDIVSTFRSEGKAIYDEYYHINDAGVYLTIDEKIAGTYDISHGVSISECLTRDHYDDLTRNGGEIDTYLSADVSIMCLYSMSNIMNVRLKHIPEDILSRIGIFNYPDDTAVRNVSPAFGISSEELIPSLSILSPEVSVTPDYRRESNVSFSTNLETRQDEYFKLSVRRVLLEDELFMSPQTSVENRSVADKVLPYLDGRVEGNVLMLGEAPGELASMLAMSYPETRFIVTSKKPTSEDDLTFLPELSSMDNVVLRYMDANTAIKSYKDANISLVLSDVGVRDIHVKDREEAFNELVSSIISDLHTYMGDVPVLIKNYTPTLFYPDFGMSYVKPMMSGSMNREFYMIKGWLPNDALSINDILERQVQSLSTKVEVVNTSSVDYLNWEDWSTKPTVSTHDFYTMAQFSTYLKFNLPVRETLLFDPHGDDSLRWLVFIKRSGKFSSSDVDTHANTISYVARVSGTMIRNRLPHMLDDSLYDVRREIGIKYFMELGITASSIPPDFMIGNFKVGGRVHLKYNEGGETRYASVSGHLISEILYSGSTQSLDFSRMFRSLLNEKNVSKYKTHSVRVDGERVQIGNILSEHQAYEGNEKWHNYHEYRIAVRVAEALSATLGIPIYIEDIQKINQFLDHNKELLMSESPISRSIRTLRAGNRSNLNVR